MLMADRNNEGCGIRPVFYTALFCIERQADMKRKYMALVLGLTLMGSQVGAVIVNAEETAAEAPAEAGSEAAQAADENAVYGEVTAVEDGQITIAVGTMGQEPGSELEKTGEEQTLTVTEDTVITKQSGMGGGQGGPGGDGGSAPEMPSGENSGDSGSAPEKPSDDGNASSDAGGEAPADAGSDNGEAPEKPEGEDGQAPEGDGSAPSGDGSGQEGAPGAQSEEASLDDMEVGDIVAVTLNDDGSAATITIQSADGGMGGGMGGPGSSSGSVTYEALNEYTESADLSGEEITSTGTDENAVLLSDEAAEVTVSDSTITRDSDDSTGGDNSSFYGVGAAALATAGTLYVSDSTITTDAKGGAGIFSYGDGVVYAANDTITTSQDTSGGIHVAGGGTLYAWNMTVNTAGESSAAIRSDRGSGTMVVDGGTYTSTGTGSPAIYSTADITVNGAELSAEGSEAICIEGLNTIRLYDCNLYGSMAENDQNDVVWNVIVYQSMSGDSEEGNGTFEMNGGTLTAENGGMFYTTNTESTIILNGVEIIPSETNDFFLQCTGNSNARGWGESGSNGADCLFTGISQTMEGDVIWDTISTLDFYMTQGSTLTGAVVNDETWAGNGGDGYANLYIDETSTWIVTGDSTVTNLSCAGNITDADGNTVTIVGTDGTVYVEGSSEYTITVSSYSDTADVSGASVSSTWEDYAVEMPAQLT